MQKIKDWLKKQWELFKAHPVIVFIIKWWKKFITLIDTEEFKLSFPFFIIGLNVLFTHSILMFIALVIWVVVFLRNINGK
jgi:hypothetical protein